MSQTAYKVVKLAKNGRFHSPHLSADRWHGINHKLAKILNVKYILNKWVECPTGNGLFCFLDKIDAEMYAEEAGFVGKKFLLFKCEIEKGGRGDFFIPGPREIIGHIKPTIMKNPPKGTVFASKIKLTEKLEWSNCNFNAKTAR